MRTLSLPEVARLRPLLVPEHTVFGHRTTAEGEVLVSRHVGSQRVGTRLNKTACNRPEVNADASPLAGVVVAARSKAGGRSRRTTLISKFPDAIKIRTRIVRLLPAHLETHQTRETALKDRSTESGL